MTEVITKEPSSVITIIYNALLSFKHLI